MAVKRTTVAKNLARAEQRDARLKQSAEKAVKGLRAAARGQRRAQSAARAR